MDAPEGGSRNPRRRRRTGRRGAGRRSSGTPARWLGHAVDLVLLSAAAVLLLGPGGWLREWGAGWVGQRKARAELAESWPEVVREGGVLAPGPGAGAPVLVEFTDYRCPYCGRAQAAVDSVAATGGARVLVRHLPLRQLHPDAPALARIAVCAEGEPSFPAVHRALFDAPAAGDTAALRELLERAGVGRPDRLLRCADSEGAKRRVQADLSLAVRLGLRATPTFVTEGRVEAGALSRRTLLAMLGLQPR